MAYSWGPEFKDSDGINYCLGYECTVSDNKDDINKSDVTVKLQLAWYLTWDSNWVGTNSNTNNTRVYWGGNKDPKTEGANVGWSGWTTVASNSTVNTNTTKQWVYFDIGTAEKTYSKSTSSQSYDLTITMTDLNEMSQYPKAVCNFTIPAKNTVHILYHPNGGTTTQEQNEYGWIKMNGSIYFHSLCYNDSGDPYNAATLGLSRTGYQFGGWRVASTGSILDQDTNYSSTTYADRDDSSVTTANTREVYCYLEAVWIPNKITIKYHSNGADYCILKGQVISVLSSSDSVVLEEPFEYDAYYGDGLSNVQNDAHLYLSKTDYNSTGYWGTEKSGGKLINHNTSFTGQELAATLGTSINSSNVTVDLYAQWEFAGVKVYARVNGKLVLGTLYARKSTSDAFKLSKGLYQRQNGALVKIK